MSTNDVAWEKLVRSKEYREHFVAASVKHSIPFQIRALMKNRNDMKQEELADASGLSQGVVSRAASPHYGNLTLNTIVRVAAGFDVAFIGKFVPFSELSEWLDNLSDISMHVPSFTEEARQRPATLVSRRRQRARPALSLVPKTNATNDRVVARRQDRGLQQRFVFGSSDLRLEANDDTATSGSVSVEDDSRDECLQYAVM